MQGERRFGKNMSKAHVNKFIKLWAEKEMRNLLRLRRSGINCPLPVALRDHVLVMTFIGTGSQAAPKLADVQLSAMKFDKLYRQCLLLMRTMFHECHLVHSDLSEYNLLYHRGELVVIDLSHAIGSDNANAATFLRDDCVNVTRFFSRRGVKTLSPRSTFEFIIQKIDDEDDAPSTTNITDDIKMFVELESSLMSQVLKETNDDARLSSTSNSETTSTTSDNLEDDDVAPVVCVDTDVDVELAKRAERHTRQASTLLDFIVDRDGQIGAFETHNMSAADAAFLDKHMPRSLHEVVDVDKFSIDDDAFGLIVKKK